MAGQEEELYATVAKKGKVPAMPTAPKPSVNESKPYRTVAHWVRGEESDRQLLNLKLLKGDKDILYSELEIKAIADEGASCAMLPHYPFNPTFAIILTMTVNDGK